MDGLGANKRGTSPPSPPPPMTGVSAQNAAGKTRSEMKNPLFLRLPLLRLMRSAASLDPFLVDTLAHTGESQTEGPNKNEGVPRHRRHKKNNNRGPHLTWVTLLLSRGGSSHLAPLQSSGGGKVMTTTRLQFGVRLLFTVLCVFVGRGDDDASIILLGEKETHTSHL